jgi:hypothetical protein
VSLVASCDKLQDVLVANRRLRDVVDQTRGDHRAAADERDELLTENLALRARLDAYDALMLEHVAQRTAQQIISKAGGAAAGSRKSKKGFEAPANVGLVALVVPSPRKKGSRDGDDEGSGKRSVGQAAGFCSSMPSANHHRIYSSMMAQVPVAPATPMCASARGRPASAGAAGPPTPPPLVGAVSTGVPPLSYMRENLKSKN